MIARRELMAASFVGAGLLATPAANACTILPARKEQPFRNSECERQIRELVAFINEAPGLAPDAVSSWVDERNIEVDSDYQVSENVGGPLYNYLFFREFRMSYGKLDPDPIKIKEINLIRRVKNQASFQFTLLRNQYFAADPEGCNGLFTHDEYYGKTETAFIATFLNNKLKGFRDFPEWFA